jgi:phosphopantetheine--protein transferase-like protein
MNSGVVPPNMNADSIEPKLRQYSTVFHPTKALKMPHRINATLLKSFGFGQVGGEVLIVHPDFVLATLSPDQYKSYLKRRTDREKRAALYTTNSILQVSPLVKVKSEPPFKAEDESRVYLDPNARATFNPAKDTWTFPAAEKHLSVQLPKDLHGKGVGVDVQLIIELPVDNADFICRNYTPEEIKYCSAQPDAAASFAGKWAAKEAVIKALCSQSAGKPEWLKGAGASLKEIQVMAGPSGAPEVTVSGVAQRIRLSVSHSGSYAVAVAVVE